MQKSLVLSEFKRWLESPVAETVRYALEQKLAEAYEKRADCYFQGEPEKTQETRAHYMGQESILRDLVELLKVDEDALIEYFTDNGIELVLSQEEADEERYGE